MFPRRPRTRWLFLAPVLLAPVVHGACDPAREASLPSEALPPEELHPAERVLEVLPGFDPAAPVSSARGARLPFDCRVVAGGEVVAEETRVESLGGRVEGTRCEDLRVVASGRETLIFSATGAPPVRLELVVAIAQRLDPELGERLVIRDDPSFGWWAPTAIEGPGGAVQLYAAGYQGNDRAHLVRLDSDDGVEFRFSGILLRHDEELCALRGSGIENVAIVPRAEGGGLRMFFAAGSFLCYGWQVFSAISEDGREWEVEPGVRISNGSRVPSGPGDGAPWPVGEGISIRETPEGWCLITGGVVPEPGSDGDAFEIVEWCSVDQLEWRFSRPVLTRAGLGLPRTTSLYSPVTRALAPGLERLYFVESSAAGTRIRTALSVGGGPFLPELVLAEPPDVRLYYVTLAFDRAYFVHRDEAGTYFHGARLVDLDALEAQ